MESSPDLFNSMGSRWGVTRGRVESSKDPGRPRALRSGVCGVSRSHEMASKKLIRVLVSLKIRAIATTITTLSFGGGSRAPHMLKGRKGLRLLRAATLNTE